MIKQALSLLVPKEFFMAKSKNPLQSLHESQYKTLTQPLLLVNSQDEIIGQIDRKKAHQNEYIFSKGAHPHRAFSIFLFNSKNQLLLHKRSQIKITFPNYWTNTCCSHPQDFQDERPQHEGKLILGLLEFIQLKKGTKLAAQRRLNFEFNIKIDELSELKLVDKLLYKSPSDSTWGEYELDYIFFLRKEVQNITPNPEEISEFQWVGRNQLRDFLRSKEAKGEKITPWFQKIIDNKIDEWWLKMERGQIQDKVFTSQDNKKILYF